MPNHAPSPGHGSGPPYQRPYRIIYQADTSHALQISENVDDYLHGMFGFMEDTAVDALFWHDGAGGNTANYESNVLELTGERIGKVNPFLRQMIDEGNDPPAAVVREARRRGKDIFCSFRINDCHDSIDEGKWVPQLLATFKLEHPEWMIGRGHPYGGLHQLNFAVPEVRELKFAVIEEVFRKYDFDGLEIDFMRSAPHFIPGEEPRNAPVLTELLRRVRTHLDKRGKERGRPIALAVRVTETMEGCRLDGFDVATWIDERLIDMIILGSGALDIEVEAFRRLTEGTGILVYPCLYGWPGGYNPIPPDMVRALATNYWHQGADGIYTFNWNAHTYAQRPDDEVHAKFAHLVERLREIHDPEALRGKDKMFAADRGSPSVYYPHNYLNARLPNTLDAGERADVPILIGEDFSNPPAPKRIGLTIGLDEPSDNATIDVSLNGKPLPNIMRGETEMTCALTAGQFVTGPNHVVLCVTQGRVTISAVEVRVSY